MMTREELEKRSTELRELEKQAWAQVNFIQGARTEIERLIESLSQPLILAPTPSVEEPCPSESPS